jgi:hypothetical protein
MKLLFFLAILGVGGVIYLLWPTSGFPPPPPDSLISYEPADNENPYRRAFYTDLDRSEIVSYYIQTFNSLFQIRLNLPPEDAQLVIRDQTRSGFLEELVHPGKDALYINGFYPSKPQDIFVRDGKIYRGKITVRYVPSHPVTRLTGLGLILISAYLLMKTSKYV